MVFYGRVSDGSFTKGLGIQKGSSNLEDAYDLCSKQSASLGSENLFTIDAGWDNVLSSTSATLSFNRPFKVSDGDAIKYAFDLEPN